MASSKQPSSLITPLRQLSDNSSLLILARATEFSLWTSSLCSENNQSYNSIFEFTSWCSVFTLHSGARVPFQSPKKLRLRTIWIQREHNWQKLANSCNSMLCLSSRNHWSILHSKICLRRNG